MAHGIRHLLRARWMWEADSNIVWDVSMRRTQNYDVWDCNIGNKLQA